MNARTNRSLQRFRNTLLIFLLITCLGIVSYTTGTRAASCGAGVIAGVSAIGNDGNVPANVLDNNRDTRWSYSGQGAWLQADLGAPKTVCGLGIAWYRGDIRANHFVLQGSLDGQAFADLYRGDSSGKTLDVEQYAFAQPTAARFLRVVVNGNTSNNWASMTELLVSVVAGDPILQNPVPPTAVPAPTTPPATAVPAPTTPPAPSTGKGIWVSREDLSRLPMSGDAWNWLKSAADSSWGSANIADQNSRHDQLTLSGALVYARTGDQRYRTKVIAALQSAIGTDANADPDCETSPSMARSLAVSRNLSSYVIAADVIGLRPGTAEADPWAKYVQFIRFKKNCRNNGGSPSYNLSESHDNGSSNGDALAGGSRIAAALYLGDKAEVDRAWQTYQRYAGDASKCASCKPNLNSNGRTWSYTSDAAKQVAINPAGATKNGHPIGGAIVNDQGRGGAFSWPPGYTAYPWEGLQGFLVQAELLQRAGYPAYAVMDRAPLRAVQYQYDLSLQFGSKWFNDEAWVTWVINKAYGVRFPTVPTSGRGKNMSWTDWTHQ